jgi:hypothetical protein
MADTTTAIKAARLYGSTCSNIENSAMAEENTAIMPRAKTAIASCIGRPIFFSDISCHLLPSTDKKGGSFRVSVDVVVLLSLD